MSKHADSSAQPAPTGNGSPVAVEVVKDLLLRREHGVKKYGTELKAGNGRDALSDLYQELQDALMYTKQALMERDAPKSPITTGIERETIIEAVRRAHNAIAGHGNSIIFAREYFNIGTDDLGALYYKLCDLQDNR